MQCAQRYNSASAQQGAIGIALVLLALTLSALLLIATRYVEQAASFSAKYIPLIRREAELLTAIAEGKAQQSSTTPSARMACQRYHAGEDQKTPGIELCGITPGLDVASVALLDGLTLAPQAYFPLLNLRETLKVLACPLQASKLKRSDGSIYSEYTCLQKDLTLSDSLRIRGNLELQSLQVSCTGSCELQILGSASIQQLRVESPDLNLLVLGDLYIKKITGPVGAPANVRLASASGSLRVASHAGLVLAAMAWNGLQITPKPALGVLAGLPLVTDLRSCFRSSTSAHESYE